MGMAHHRKASVPDHEDRGGEHPVLKPASWQPPVTAERFDPRTNVYGLARTLLATGMFATLMFTPAMALFHPVIGMSRAPYCDGVSAVSGFCIGGDGLSPDARRYLLALLLVPSIIGWRPRIFVIWHWWVAFSIADSLSLPDGGDNVALILTLAIIPFGLADDRKWHWLVKDEKKALSSSVAAFCYVTHWAIRIQVAGIYFQSAVAKFGVREWADGTALYYWLNDPTFGLLDPWKPVLQPFLENKYTVTALTWGTICVELTQAFALFWNIGVRKRVFWLGILLHSGIALFMGLFSFAVTMFGALVLVLHDPNVDLDLDLRRLIRNGRAEKESENGSSSSAVHDRPLVLD
ncbi:sporulation-delaying protein SdpB family protein [Streptomyces sp. SAS_267]|uniref:sporulation-delaying protein SdpB family protein n=1 Tax=Streptomyces sp. SAS_267 TaxID=3412750 RepID=UPI00403C4617